MQTTARRLAQLATTLAVVVGSAGQALALGLTPRQTVEAVAAAVLDGAPDWGDAVTQLTTSPLDSSDAAGRYDDPYFVNWPAFLPSYPDASYTPRVYKDCTKGQIQCVDKVIREMTRRYDQLGCDHNAVFNLTYLYTTEAYRDYWYTGAFDDPAWLNHYDAVFGEFYFDAVDAWESGDLADVPPAWRIAFDNADARTVTGTGDVFLGMNAHIRRDLPFVIEAIGQVAEDGSSRKPDHDRVNEFLNTVNHEVLPLVAARHDPTADDGDVPYTSIDQSATVHIVTEWREEAWRKAEMLLNASTTAERDRIARWIENEAAASALAITYAFASDDTAPRDAFCAAWLATL